MTQNSSHNFKPHHYKHHHSSMWMYVTGFLFSAGFTLVVYLLVAAHDHYGHQKLSHGFLTFTILFLAVIQLFVQLYYFLHLGKDLKSRMRSMVLLLTAIVVIVVVFGSLWIIKSLNKNMLHNRKTEDFILKDELIKK